jgi:hypothetical protein
MGSSWLVRNAEALYWEASELVRNAEDARFKPAGWLGTRRLRFLDQLAGSKNGR